MSLRTFLAFAIAGAIVLPVPHAARANPAENNGSGIGIGIDLLQLLKKKKKKAKPATKKPTPAKKVTKKPASKPATPKLSLHAPPPGETRFRNKEVLFILDPTAPDGALAAITAAQNLSRITEIDLALLTRRLHRYAITDGRSVAAVVTALENDNRIEIAQPNYTYELAEASNVSVSVQYANELMQIPAAQEIATGKSVLVAIIDSRIDAGHPALAGHIADTITGADGEAKEPDSHGTAMAGAIAASGTLTGTAPAALLLSVEAFARDEKGKVLGSSYHILRGVDWAFGKGAAIFNMSFAGPADPLLSRLMADATAKGAIFVAATGNAGSKSPPLYPAADKNVIAVTAVDAKRKLYTRANRGEHVDIAAPGVDVIALAPGNATAFSTGTSIAAAHVSGILALAVERKGKINLPEALSLLGNTAAKLGQPRAVAGAGLADGLKLVEAAVPAEVKAESQ
jgi:subtilisin family serine protease